MAGVPILGDMAAADKSEIGARETAEEDVAVVIAVVVDTVVHILVT